MYQGYGQQPVRAPQNYSSMQAQVNNRKGCLVSYCEAVYATGTYFDASVYSSPDITHKTIYLNHVGIDGTALLNNYEQRP